MLRLRKPIVSVVVGAVSLLTHTGPADSQTFKDIHVGSLRLSALNTYERSEEPYLLMFNWRVIPGESGSASVTYRKVEPNFNENFERGKTIEFERKDLSISNVEPWELAGTIVIAMEHDNTSNVTIDELMGRYVADPLRVGLQSIESLSLPSAGENGSRFTNKHRLPAFNYYELAFNYYELAFAYDGSSNGYDTILKDLRKSLTEDILTDKIGDSLFRRRLNADDFVGYGATAWWNIPQENTAELIPKLRKFTDTSVGIVGGLLSSQSENELVFASDWAESKYKLNLSTSAR